MNVEETAQDACINTALIEKERVEQVFGLTGGELEDAEWKCKDQNGNDRQIRFWYEGVPEYAGRTVFPDLYDTTYRTVVSPYVHGTEEVLEDEDGRWYRVKLWGTSGETECPWVGCEDHDGHEERPCKLCDAGEGEDHGHIYLGEGWGEAVYKQDPVREVMES